MVSQKVVDTAIVMRAGRIMRNPNGSVPLPVKRQKMSFPLFLKDNFGFLKKRS